MKRNILKITTMMLIVTAGLIACNEQQNENSDIAVTGITLNKNTVTLAPGDTLTLVPAITPADAGDKTVRWTSSNTTVATVNSEGLITAAATGSTTITVTTKDGGKTATCEIQVISVSITAITLNKEQLELVSGNKGILAVTVAPDNATYKKEDLTWTSSDPEVAVVSAVGEVTAVAPGRAVIEVSAKGSSCTASLPIWVAGPECDMDHYFSEPVKLPVTQYVLNELGCNWHRPWPIDLQERVFIINSDEELREHIVVCRENYPDIDFSKHSVLWAYGRMNTFFWRADVDLFQDATCRYTLQVVVAKGMYAAESYWYTAITTPKIAEYSDIKLDVEIEKKQR